MRERLIGMMWSEAESGMTTGVGHGDGDARRCCVLPKVQPVADRRDQQVPVYRDETVPEWRSSKWKQLASGSGRPSRYVRARHDAAMGDGHGSWRNSSEVSFDDIMSMYQSSVVEKASSGSRAVREIMRHRSRSRHVCRPWLWRSGPQLKCSRFGQRDVGDSLLRSLQEAIERTSICDLPASSNNLHHASVVHARRCEFQRRCAPLTLSSLMLTTSSL